MNKGLNFKNMHELKKWLTDSANGLSLLNEACRKVYRPSTVRLLAIEYPDRVELFGEKHVCVRVVQALDVQSPKAELLAEELVDLQLPRAWRQLFTPGFRRAILIPQKTTIDQALGRRWYAGLVRATLNLDFSNPKGNDNASDSQKV